MPSTFRFKNCSIKLILLITLMFTYVSAVNSQVRIFLPSKNQVIQSGNNIVLEFSTMAIPGECIAQLYLGTNYVKTYYNVMPDIENNLSSVGLAPGTTYRLKVMDDGDNGYAWSQYFTIGGLAAPTAYAASSIGSTSFRANWSVVASATEYRLDVSTSSTFSTFVSGFNNLSVTTNYKDVTGLNPGTTYYYRVRAKNATATSTNSATITLTTIQTVPAAPVATAVTAFSPFSFTANWNVVSGATSYRLDVSTSSSFSSYVTGYQNLTVNTNSQSVSGLSPGILYYYRVRAVNSAGTSANSNIISYATILIAPNSSTGFNITSNSYTVSWNSITNASGYLLDVSTSSDFSTKLSGYDNLLVNNTIATISGLSPGTTYYHRVKAVNSVSTSSYSISYSTTTSPPPPSAPTAVNATEITTNSFVANWEVVPEATSYRIDVSTRSDFSSFVNTYYNNCFISENFIQVDDDIISGTTYYYRVRAVNSFGVSQNSNSIQVNTFLNSPTGMIVTDVT